MFVCVPRLTYEDQRTACRSSFSSLCEGRAPLVAQVSQKLILLPPVACATVDGADKWGPLNLQSKGFSTSRNTIWVCVGPRLSALLTFRVFQKPTVSHETFWTSAKAASVLSH